MMPSLSPWLDRTVGGTGTLGHWKGRHFPKQLMPDSPVFGEALGRSLSLGKRGEMHLRSAKQHTGNCC